MNNILALDTSTDACSVAWRCGARVSNRFQLIPRQHNHRLFEMLGELLPAGAAEAGVQLLAYGQGPGSFTGLRIAASAVQGLSYTLGAPVAGVSTLACLAQGALRRGVIDAAEQVLALLDARINEVYWGLYRFEDGLAVPCVDDQVSAPGDLPADLLQQPAVAMGSGLDYLESLPPEVQQMISRSVPEQWPDSLDLLPLADREAKLGRLLDAAAVQPVYLRNEIHWKKLSEQGPARG
jgi:tRNA threonylcarbamoyladenosine biosynthesis protein TsaB